MPSPCYAQRNEGTVLFALLKLRLTLSACLLENLSSFIKAYGKDIRKQLYFRIRSDAVGVEVKVKTLIAQLCLKATSKRFSRQSR